MLQKVLPYYDEFTLINNKLKGKLLTIKYEIYRNKSIKYLEKISIYFGFIYII